ncbi:hypothetical protein BGLA2_2130019 [Burkholderia gladioli]|nr:hypothetical protein BGLA2_2130019 [Burkholderia gladioli]
MFSRLSDGFCIQFPQEKRRASLRGTPSGMARDRPKVKRQHRRAAGNRRGGKNSSVDVAEAQFILAEIKNS